MRPMITPRYFHAYQKTSLLRFCISLFYYFLTTQWAITADKTTQTVCIGGINQMTTQNIRGGGTVCMFQPKTWQSMMGFISSVEECK
jgi:hypothetical protein